MIKLITLLKEIRVNKPTLFTAELEGENDSDIMYRIYTKIDNDIEFIGYCNEYDNSDFKSGYIRCYIDTEFIEGIKFAKSFVKKNKSCKLEKQIQVPKLASLTDYNFYIPYSLCSFKEGEHPDELKNSINEIKVTKPVKFATFEDQEHIDELTKSLGEGDSGFDLYEPMYETYSLDDFYGVSDGTHDEISYFTNKYPNCILLGQSVDVENGLENSIAPKGSFTMRLTISKYKIKVEVPYINVDGNELVGWFTRSGEYVYDKRFNEEGEMINND